MKTKGIELGWIVVNDLKKSIAFYTDVVGLEVTTLNEEFGWAELKGSEGGAHLGLAQTNPMSPIPAGANAVMTISVPDINEARTAMQSKGATLIGEVIEVPGHVKMQLFTDADGNHCQIVETL